MTDNTTPVDMNDIEARYQKALNTGGYWQLSADELLAAYAMGRRKFYRCMLPYRADLSGAVLRGADLRDAVLRGADLRDADLSGADLRDAVLRGADLSGADLRDADLSGAVLSGADLRDAVLRGADLRDAVLRGAVLRGADLRDADLRDADLSGAQADFWAKCMKRPHELAGLRLALVEGRIDGSAYEGECACFVGTLANIAQCGRYDLGIAVDSGSPIERLFYAIKKGDTPETNPISAIVLGWLDDLMAFGSALNGVPATTEAE